MRAPGYGTMVSLALLLSACGGGGNEEGSGVTTPPGDQVTLSLLDCSMLDSDAEPSPSTCNPTSYLTLGEPAIAYARVTDNSGQPQANMVAAIIIDGTSEHIIGGTSERVITTVPASGLQETNENGAVTYSLMATSVADGGSMMVTVPELNIRSVPIDLPVKVPDLTLTLKSSLTSGQSLAHDGALLITATVTDATGNPFILPLDIQFSSICAADGLAILDSQATTTNGVANSTYRPAGCLKQDTIYAETELSKSAYMDVPITPAPRETITFQSATPEVIYLSEAAGAHSTTLRFRVTDPQGYPLSGQRISFALTTSPYGPELQPMTAISTSEGMVETQLSGGQLPGTFLVEASMPSPGDSSVIISDTSDKLTVLSGVPVQDSFTFELSQHAIEASSSKNVEVELRASVADEHGNPVPDGTRIYFHTEGDDGHQSCSISEGGCLIVWHSEEHIQPANGRTTLLIASAGQESFIDNNVNGYWDDSEPYYTLSEAWLDDNENGVFDSDSEFFRDNNMNGEFDLFTGGHNNSIPAAQVTELYNGLFCLPEDEANGLCSRRLVELFTSEVIVWSTPQAFITAPIVSADQVQIRVQDLNGNQMPAGTIVELSAEPEQGVIIFPNRFIIADGTRFGDLFGGTVKRLEGTYGGFTLKVTVTTPEGTESIVEVPIPAQ